MSRSSSHLLVVDLGSSSVRATVHRADGTPLSEPFRVTHRPRRHPTGSAVLEPDRTVDRVARAVDGALAAARAAHVEVHAVAMAAMWHGVCGVDPAGRTTVPILTWADRRAAGAAAALRRRLDDTAQHARTGARLHPSYVPAKLAWLAERHPRRFAATACWLSPADLVHLRLFGRAATSVSMASGTGLLDQHSCTWDRQILRAVPVDTDHLPPVDDTPARGLRRPFARRWPELARVPWFPALGDGAAANVGLGCLGTDRTALTLGTTAALRVLYPADDPTIPDTLFCYRLDSDHPLVGGALSEGGGVVAWLRDILRLPGPAATEERIAAMRPGAHGLTVLPTFAGERSPGWHDHAAGTVSGMSTATDPLDVLRATMEAVALRLAVVAAHLDHAMPDRAPAVVGGGNALSASPAWQQIIADALGVPLAVSAEPEASSRGAALWAAHRLDATRPLAAPPPPVSHVTHPDPARHDTYRRMLDDQQRLGELLDRP